MVHKNNLKNRWIAVILIVTLCLATWLVYAPGLSGNFIFDDFHSLKKLEVLGGELTWQGLINYFGLSDTGPLKRPISVFSFLIDGQDWPTGAYAFKRTNVIIHIINGLLLFCLLKYLFSRTQTHRRQSTVIALFATGIWLLHPFMVSTTLYIVQRMAMLPMTFMLLGFLLYSVGRFRYAESSNIKNQLILCMAVFGGTGLAMLSKENGVLFLWLVILFEFLIVQKYLGLNPLSKGLARMLLYLPAALLVVALLIKMPGFMERYDERTFTVIDRLLTQFRVVSDYIYHLLIPKYFTAGVFNDGFVTSESLFKPVSTIIALVFITGLLVLAWLLRNKYVWFSFAVLFYFIAQLLESTVIPLEMYFEHRNYVSAAFMGVPISLALIQLSQRSRIFMVIPVVILFLLAFLTFLRSSVWGDNFKMHEMTMNKYPESKRAFTITADYYVRNGYREMAIMTISTAIKYHDNLEFKLNQIILLCNHEWLDEQFLENLYQAFKTERFLFTDIPAFTSLYKKLLNNECDLDPNKNHGLRLFEALRNNPFTDRAHSKTLIRAYQVYYEIEKHNYVKAKELIAEIIQDNLRYYDLFEMLDAMIAHKQFDLVNELLVLLKSEYALEYQFKPDFQMFGDIINEYQKVVDNKEHDQKNIDHHTSEK